MIFWAVAALQAVALILAAWRRPLPRILLALTAYSLADELLVEALHGALDGAPRPFTGLRLAGYHASVCLVVGWPAVLAAAAWRVFAGPQKTNGPVSQAAACRQSGSVPAQRPHGLRGEKDGAAERPPQVRNLWAGVTTFQPLEVIFGAWLIAAGGIAACYPLPRGWTQPVLHAAEVFFVVAALAAIPVGWKRRTIATPEGQAVGLLVVVELVVCVLGAWAWGAKVFDRATWDELARVPYGLGWLVLCGLLVRRAASPPTARSA